jgi:RNA-directed DNA polymerase
MIRVIQLPKKSGGYRTIHIPNDLLKRRLEILTEEILNELSIHRDAYGVAHAFMPGRSIVTNAQAHVGPEWACTITFDFTDFFDSCTIDHLKKSCGKEMFKRIIRPFSPNYPIAPQGFPSSPAIANICAAPFDEAVMALRDSMSFRGRPFVYTRYADDLSFSCRSRKIAERLAKEIPVLAQQHGFTINPKKTHLQLASRGRRIICGIAVSSTGIHSPRSIRRRLRAALHAQSTGHLTPRRLSRTYRRDQPYRTLKEMLDWHIRGLKNFLTLRPPKNLTTPVHRPPPSANSKSTKSTSSTQSSTLAFGLGNRKIHLHANQP